MEEGMLKQNKIGKSRDRGLQMSRKICEGVERKRDIIKTVNGTRKVNLTSSMQGKEGYYKGLHE